MYLSRFKTKPYEHQIKEFEKFKDIRGRALLWQMRSGKSKTIVDLACYLYSEGKIDGVVVVAPNGVHANWHLVEIPKHSWDGIIYDSFVWVSSTSGLRKQAKQKYLAEITPFVQDSQPGVLKWFLVNKEALRHKKNKQIMGKFINKACPRFLVVFDESHHFGEPGASQTKTAKALSGKAAYVRLLSGSSVDNSPLKAYSQFQMVGAGCLGFNDYESFKEYFADYEKSYGRGGRTYPKIAQYKNLGELRDRISQHSSVVLRDDCPDLPKLTSTNHYFEMSPTHQDIYNAMSRVYEIAVARDEKVKAKDEGPKRVKLQQISSGFILDSDKKCHRFVGEAVRETTLLKILKEDIPKHHKIIIWAHFTAELERISEILTESKLSFVKYFKGVSAKEKQHSIKKFREDDSIKYFVGQPASAGEGLDLSSADSIVYFSRSANAIHAEQSKERASKIGKKQVDIHYIIGRHTIDQRIDYCLTKKLDIADMVVKHGLKWLLDVVE